MAPLKQRLVLLVICLGVFMGALDGTMVVISLPQIAAYFHCSLAQISWVIIAFALASSSFLLSWGRMGDLLPPGRLFLVGLVLFTVASVNCGLSQNWHFLVIGRCLQGLGASIILASKHKIIVRVFDPGALGLPLGLLDTALAVGVIVGTPLGGFLTHHFGWRYIFFINVPLCGMALILGARSLAQLSAESCWDRKSCNLSSGLILAGCVGGLILSMSWLRGLGCYNGYTLSAFGLGAGLFGLLLYVDHRHCSPLLPPTLWRDKTFLFGSVGVMPASMSFQGTFFILPFFMDQVYHYAPYEWGLLLLPLSVTSAVAASLSGFLADRWSNLFVLRSGAAILTLGLASLIFTSTGSSVVTLGLMFALVGLGFGLFHTPNLNAVLLAMQPSMVGLAASSVTLLKTFASILGITLIVGVFAWVNKDNICLGPGVCLEIQSFHLAFTVMAVCAGINFLIHFIVRR